jgi:Domain of unknown function (DUF5666)
LKKIRMIRRMASTHKPIKQLLCTIGLLLICTQTLAAIDACSVASTTNPNLNDGGMGGTGVIANGGLGGTGVTAEGGLGGTGVTADGGLGGTGVSTEHGGMGGTGDAVVGTLLPNDSQGGIAIVGVVTGFASVCVNGVEVHYDASTPVFDNGDSTQLSSLAAGKMVMLKADEVNGQLRARSIGMFDALVGPIDKLDIKNLQMEVMGQIVQLDEMTMQQMRALSSGAMVRVSGHRLANGAIVATRVGVTNNKSLASTLGIVTNVASDGFSISGTKINLNNKNMLDKIKVGNEMRVSGAWNRKAIKASHIEAQPIKNMMNRSNSAIMEGFVGLDGSSSMSLAGTEIVFSQIKASYRSIVQSHGKVVKMEVHRDKTGKWVCDKLDEREGALFIRNNHSKHSGSSNRGRSSSKNEYEEDSADVNSDKEDSGSGSSGSGSSKSGSSSSGSGSGISSSGTSGSGSRISVPSTSGSSGSGSSGSGSSGSSGSGSSGSGKKK